MEPLDIKLNFNKVGGLEEHIKILKQMILLPLLYREAYDKFYLKPPRGVLFHGPPGTGKTLVAGALANECSVGDRKVSFFSRKGSDILSKYVGDSETRLKKLFELAHKRRPSIIFFDELDGLAPPRSERQDHVHSSIVSILLAHMDGLGSTSSVVVIGATNRIDGVDPALRRPGRFDKELYFPLPSCKAREAILRVHTDRWQPRPSPEMLSYLAGDSSGYCGADLQALCSEAVMCSLRRKHPNIYDCSHKIKINLSQLKVSREDFLQAKASLVPAAHRVATTPVKKLAPFIEPLLQSVVDEVVEALDLLFPHAFLDPGAAGSDAGTSPAELAVFPRLLLTGSSLQGLTSHLGPALLHHYEHLPVHVLDETVLFRFQTPDASCIQVLNTARQNLPGVLYLPNITVWWSLVERSTQAIFLSQLDTTFANTPLLLLATAHEDICHVPEQLRCLFNKHRGHIAAARNPTALEREHFFFPLFNISSHVVLPAPAPNSARSHELWVSAPHHLRSRPTQRILRKSVRFMRQSRRLQGKPPQNLDWSRAGQAVKSSLHLDKHDHRGVKRRRTSSKRGSRSSPSLVERAAVVEENAVELSPGDGAVLGQLVDRLVAATADFPVEVLEGVYGEVSRRFVMWREHQELDRLLQELKETVYYIESGDPSGRGQTWNEKELKFAHTDMFLRSGSRVRVKLEPVGYD